MFLLAALMYLVAVYCAYLLPVRNNSDDGCVGSSCLSNGIAFFHTTQDDANSQKKATTLVTSDEGEVTAETPLLP